MITARAALILTLFCAVAFLPGFFALPVVDRDEARFAQASRQMSASSSPIDCLVPLNQDRPRLQKPPLVYWLQATAARFANEVNETGWRSQVWPYRIPSLLAAVLAVLATWRLGREMFEQDGGTRLQSSGGEVGVHAATLAAVMLAAAPVLVWEARQARADAALLLLTVLAQTHLWRIWRRAEAAGAHPERDVWLLWLFVSAAVLTKGPVVPLVITATILSLCFVSGKWRWLSMLRPGPGLAIAVTPILAWTVVVGFAVGWEALGASLRDEYLLRAVTAREGHSGPPGYHLLLVWALCWPASLLLLPGMIGAIRDVRRGRDPAAAFLLAWVTVPWIFFELAATKLPHYVMPLYPAIALLAGRAAFATRADLTPFVDSTWGRAGFHLWLAIGAVLGVVVPLAIGGGLLVTEWGAGAAWVALLTPVIAVADTFLLVRIRLLVRAFDLAAAARTAAFVSVLGMSCSVVAVARISSLHVGGRIVAALERIDPTATRPLAAVEYHEDSLIFLSRGRVERIDSVDLADWISAHPHGLVVAPRSLPPQARPLRELGRVSGWNYSKGRRVELGVFENFPAARDLDAQTEASGGSPRR